MKTSSRRYKGNIEEDVSFIKGVSVFQLVTTIVVLIAAGIGIYMLVLYIGPLMSQMDQLSGLSDLMDQIPS